MREEEKSINNIVQLLFSSHCVVITAARCRSFDAQLCFHHLMRMSLLTVNEWFFRIYGTQNKLSVFFFLHSARVSPPHRRRRRTHASASATIWSGWKRKRKEMNVATKTKREKLSLNKRCILMMRWAFNSDALGMFLLELSQSRLLLFSARRDKWKLLHCGSRVSSGRTIIVIAVEIK